MFDFLDGSAVELVFCAASPTTALAGAAAWMAMWVRPPLCCNANVPTASEGPRFFAFLCWLPACLLRALPRLADASFSVGKTHVLA